MREYTQADLDRIRDEEAAKIPQVVLDEIKKGTEEALKSPDWISMSFARPTPNAKVWIYVTREITGYAHIAKGVWVTSSSNPYIQESIRRDGGYFQYGATGSAIPTRYVEKWSPRTY